METQYQIFKKTSLKLSLTVLILTGLILTACGANSTPTQFTPAASTAPSEDEPVSVIATPNELIITNNTPTAVYYAVYPQEDLALIEWEPCQHPDDCPQDRVEPGQSARLSLQTVTNTGTTIVTLFWWHLVEKSDGSGYHDADLTWIDIKIR